MSRACWSYRCNTCDAAFTAWAPAEKHADGHGGARLELVLGPADRDARHPSGPGGKRPTHPHTMPDGADA